MKAFQPPPPLLLLPSPRDRANDLGNVCSDCALTTIEVPSRRDRFAGQRGMQSSLQDVRLARATVCHRQGDRRRSPPQTAWPVDPSRARYRRSLEKGTRGRLPSGPASTRRGCRAGREPRVRRSRARTPPQTTQLAAETVCDSGPSALA